MTSEATQDEESQPQVDPPMRKFKVTVTLCAHTISASDGFLFLKDKSGFILYAFPDYSAFHEEDVTA